MAWERNFEQRVLKIREKELKFSEAQLSHRGTLFHPLQRIKEAIKLKGASG
jgi:hypothetical protein